MCGFLVYVTNGDNSKIRHRGPDCTTSARFGPFTFVHNLLSITGSFTPQPYVDDDIVCVYNGELYNHAFSRTDGEVLIPLYREYGTRFPQQLEGEFALALYDFARSIVVFATDPFKSKPLFLNGSECASYRSGVGGEKAEPNQVVVKRFDGTVIETHPARVWDLRQWKNSYDDWITAFESAVARRAFPGCFLGLSSGYDSGAIACALLQSRVPFKAYCFEGQENSAVLDARRALLACDTFVPDPQVAKWLAANIDNEPYTIVCDGKPVSTRVLDDGATFGIATIARRAQAEGRRVCLSGQGADEVMSDYAPWPQQSELKGTYPNELRLWRNFNYGCQESYLLKEEYAAGAFGIENRYPYLDAAVVQEFLWLSPDLKNRHYKAPLREYLMRHRFPFEEGVKRGFNVDLKSLQ